MIERARKVGRAASRQRELSSSGESKPESAPEPAPPVICSGSFGEALIRKSFMPISRPLKSPQC